MNNLKFRIWDKEKKEFLDKKIAPLMDINGNLYCWASQHWGVDNELQDPNSFIIQQFTGIQDKNENDIYEGDIIKVNRCRLKPMKEVSPGHYTSGPDDIIELGEEIGTVFWGGFTCDFLIEFPSYDDIEPLGRTSDHRIEVIGNIFEKPEMEEE